MIIPSFQSKEYEQARLFLTTITGSPDTPVWWRAIHDVHKTGATAPVGMQLSIPMRGTLRERWCELWRLNHAGYGIFMQANESNGHGQEAKDIIRVRAVFVDIDAHHGTNIPGVEAMLPPSMRVTGRAPGHLYWIVEDCPVSEFKATQNGLIKALGSDNSINNLDRIMRVPPFPNRKFKGRHPVSIVYANDLRYTLAEIHAVFPPVVARYSLARKASTGGGYVNATSVEDLESYSMDRRCDQGRRWIAKYAPAKALDGKHHHDDRRTVAQKLYVQFGIDEDIVIDMMDEWSPDLDRPSHHEEIMDWILSKTWTDRGSALRKSAETMSSELAADLDVDADVDVDTATPAVGLCESVTVPETVPETTTETSFIREITTAAMTVILTEMAATRAPGQPREAVAKVVADFVPPAVADFMADAVAVTKIETILAADRHLHRVQARVRAHSRPRRAPRVGGLFCPRWDCPFLFPLGAPPPIVFPPKYWVGARCAPCGGRCEYARHCGVPAPRKPPQEQRRAPTYAETMAWHAAREAGHVHDHVAATDGGAL